MDGANDKEIKSYVLEELIPKTNKLKHSASVHAPDFAADKSSDAPQSPKSFAAEEKLAATIEDGTKVVEKRSGGQPEASETAPPVLVSPGEPNKGQQAPLKSDDIIEHTAGLWKYNPVPENEPDPSPEYLFSEVEYPASKIVAARVRGKKHKHEGTNCDDWYETANYKDITFIAVSDGAGSKKFSRVGAKASCKAAVGYLIKTFASVESEHTDLYADLQLPLSDKKSMDACGLLAGIVQQSVITGYEAVESAYYSRVADPAYTTLLQREIDIKDLSGTLLIAVIVPIHAESKEYLIISCQVGDGMIAILNTEAAYTTSLKLMGEPDSGDYSGETEFLTSPKMHSIETLQNKTKIYRGLVNTVMVMSDGVADDYFPNETEMRRLYFDLVANGIIDGKSGELSLSNLSQEQIRLFKKLPDGLAYPWVNDQSVKIPLHYTNRICEALGLSLEDVWNDTTAIDLCRLEINEQVKNVEPCERLKIWLDNYVERGSFDDRTLVIAQM